MKLSEAKPFVRYVHLLPINASTPLGVYTPYDNRLFYVYSGVGEIALEKETVSLFEGDALIIPPGTRYEIIPPKGPLTYLAVNFDYTQSNSDKVIPVPPEYSDKFYQNLRFEALSFSDAAELSEPLCIRDFSKILGKLLQMEQEYSSKCFGFETVLSCLLLEIVTTAVRKVRSKRFSESEKTAAQIIKYVNEHFSKDVSNEDIAKVFGFHKNYVSRLIKSYTGMPLHKYLLHTRISRSMELLGQLGVGDAALACGFSDIYHFSKAFKKITGCSPSKYI